MELIDNINRLLGDDIKQTLQPGARLKIAASCFSMYAFEVLKAELEKLDELNFQGRTQVIAAYKRPNEADSSRWVLSDYVATEWLPTDLERTALPIALHLGGLYEQLLHRLIPLPARPQETLSELVTRVEQAQAKQREVDTASARLAKEKQFNRKVEINAQLRQLKNNHAALIQ